MHNLDPVRIKESLKSIQTCAHISCFLMSLIMYAVQSFHPGKKKTQETKKSLSRFFLFEVLNQQTNFTIRQNKFPKCGTNKGYLIIRLCGYRSKLLGDKDTCLFEGPPNFV